MRLVDLMGMFSTVMVVVMFSIEGFVIGMLRTLRDERWFQLIVLALSILVAISVLVPENTVGETDEYIENMEQVEHPEVRP